jgi:hypothetical protein
MRRRISFAVLAAASAFTIVPALAAGVAQAVIVGHARIATDTYTSFPDYNLTASHEQVVVLQPWQTSTIYALKAADPHVKVLMYKNVSAASSSVGPGGMYASGVSYDEAASHGWLLLNTSGSPFTFENYSWLWATDVGMAAYQNAWAANVISELEAAPWDGVFMDDLNPTIRYHYCVGCVAKYPSDAAYSSASSSFAANVGAQIQASGKLAIANIGSWPNYSSVTNYWLRYLSGGMDQQFLKWGSSPGTGYQSPATWQAQLDEVKLAEAEGKVFIGVTNSSNSDESAALYGYATALLAGGGHTLFYMGGDFTNETWFPEYDYGIGNPIGRESELRDGVHRRSFTHGLVLVNPTLSVQTVALGGSYSGSGRTLVTRVTMAPQSGLVLTSARATPVQSIRLRRSGRWSARLHGRKQPFAKRARATHRRKRRLAKRAEAVRRGRRMRFASPRT